MLHKFAHIILLLLICTTGFSQVSGTDSLRLQKSLEQARKSLRADDAYTSIDTSKIALLQIATKQSEYFYSQFLNILAEAHIEIRDFPTALSYRMRIVNLAEKNRDSLKICIAYEQNGDLFQLAQLNDKAAESYLIASDYLPSKTKQLHRESLLEKTALANLKTQFFPEAISIYRELHQLYLHQKNVYKQAKALGMIAKTYQSIPEYEMALQSYLQLYELIKPLGDASSLADCINNIAVLYLRTNQPNQAIMYYKSIEYFDKEINNDSSKLAQTYCNIAICQQNIGNYKKTIEYLEMALVLHKNSNTYQEADIQNLLAKVYLSKGDTYNAEMHVQEALRIEKQIYYLEGQEHSYQIYSEIAQANANFEDALDYHKQYLQIRDSISRGNLEQEQDKLRVRRGIEQTESQIKQVIADEDLKELRMRQLQLEADKKAKELVLLQREAELQKTELQRNKQALALAEQKNDAQLQQQRISTLQQQKAIQSVKLKEAQLEEQERSRKIEKLERDQKINELTIQQQEQEEVRMRLLIGFIIIVFLFILISFIYSRKAIKKLAAQKQEIQIQNLQLAQKSEEVSAQNEEITRQKEVIGKKNNGITNSLIYAKRIQQAAMPSLLLLKDTLKDSFVFLSPREIVSGDFFWTGKIEGRTIIAAADCTGHGVPGAFMSMLGISFLNDIVLSQDIYKASEILEQLRVLVKRSLKQESNVKRAKDGMDIALCVIEEDRKSLRFSGANNPMFLIRNGELHHYRGNRNPIGVFVKEKPFTDIEVELHEGDAIYLFSDGFVDQFGGPDGQKYMTKRFKEFLLKIHHLPMKTQRAKLREKLVDWQGNNFPQIDDVLVVGFRV